MKAQTQTMLAGDAIAIIRKAKIVTVYVNAFESEVRVSKTEMIRKLNDYKNTEITLYMYPDGEVKVESA